MNAINFSKVTLSLTGRRIAVPGQTTTTPFMNERATKRLAITIIECSLAGSHIVTYMY